VRVRASGFETACRLAEARLGIGLVPSECAARYVASSAITAVPLDEAWGMRQLNLCVASLDTLSRGAPAGRSPRRRMSRRYAGARIVMLVGRS
jgi:DNA-binding transcriptional LysR family regulator